jgi:hydrogenase-4 component F
MKISFDDVDTTTQIEEKSIMVWPQYALLTTSLVLCFWIPETLYQTIVQALATMGGGF